MAAVDVAVSRIVMDLSELFTDTAYIAMADIGQWIEKAILFIRDHAYTLYGRRASER